MLPEPKLKTLPNGVRVVTSSVPSSEITTVVVAFRAGTRGEKKRLRGIAHFTEHLLFKGTKRFPLPKDVNDAVSAIGGYLNATTNIEYTYYVMQVANHSAEKAMEILTEMTTRPRVPESEFETERPVVIDEMLQAKQNDTDQIEILFEDLIYEHQPLGWDITGTKKSLASVKRKDVLAWMHDWYVGRACAVIVVGGGDMARLSRKAAKAFGGLRAGRPPAWKPFKRHVNTKPVTRHLTRKEPLTTMMVGYPTRGFSSPMAEPLRILNIILGVNTTSRLYDRVREQGGLAYDISSLTELYSDVGHIVAWTQVEPKHADAALRGILEEFRRLNVDPVTQKEFSAAKELRLAHLKALLEDQESLVKHFMKDLFIMRRIRSIRDIIRSSEAVTLDQVREVAKRVFVPERWFMASIGARKPRVPEGL